MDEKNDGTIDGSLLPSEYRLFQNYPNPFNPSTTIRYGLPRRSQVLLTVFNTLGQQVATLVQGEQEAGNHGGKFDAAGLSSGVHFYRLTAGSDVQTRELLLVRITGGATTFRPGECFSGLPLEWPVGSVPCRETRN